MYTLKNEVRREKKTKKKQKQKSIEQHQRERQSVTRTQLLTEPFSRRHRIQSSFLLFTDYTGFDITHYTLRAKEFHFNPHYALLL